MNSASAHPAGLATKPLPGLRERQKSSRRARILAATRELFRSLPAEAVSLERIAALAELSPPTLYKLIGPREAILGMVWDEMLSTLGVRLSDLSNDDPVSHLQIFVEAAVTALTQDTAVHRAIARELAHLELGNAPDFRFNFYAVATDIFARAKALGYLDQRANAEALGHQFILSLNGIMMEWSSGRLDDASFLKYAKAVAWMSLAASASKKHRAEFSERFHSS